GIRWEWESFPEYLDALGRRCYALDVAAQVPHAALRFYVMGERGADHTETPTPEEVDAMGRLVRGAIPGDAPVGIARRMGEAGQGVFEIVSDFAGREAEWAMFRRMVEVSGRPMSILLLQSAA